ncbi:MAG: DNA polymerase I [Bacteroides sp.]|nr:DNA polymerase I [Bacteroides sp.]
MKEQNKLFLIDAYALIYRSYYALIKNPRINSKGMNTSAIMGFVNAIEEVLKKEQPTHLAIAFDPKGDTFRHEIFKEYKAQREETPEDIRMSVPIIKDIVKAYNIPILEVQGYEADDVIGTVAKIAAKENVNTYMMTPDKDYAQLVGQHTFIYRPKFTGGYEVMGEKEVKEKFGVEDTLQVIDMLGLMGDTADNIPGCKGIGEKTAQKLIAEFGSIENLMNNTDKLKGAVKTKIESGVEDIKLSKFLATIKTDVPMKVNIEELKIKEANKDELKKLFDELEFKTLAERVFGKTNNKTEQKSLFNDEIPFEEGSLFFNNQTQDAGETEKTQLQCLSTLNADYQLIDNKEKAREIIEKLMSEKTLALDTETSSTEAMEAELVGISLSAKENEAFYIPISPNTDEGKQMLEIVRPLLENEQSLKVGQNIKYDLIVLANHGIEVKGDLFDTMIAHYLIQPELRHGMDYLAEIYLNYKTISIEELIGAKGKKQKNMKELSPQDVYNYACEDADITLKLKRVLEKELKEHSAERLFTEVEMPLVRVLADMERNGVLIDTDSLATFSKQLSNELINIEQSIKQLAGEDFNISSPKQVGEVLFDKLKIVDKAKKTKTGQYVTSEEVLETLRHKHPIVERILEHRGIKKLLSTYIDALPQLINKRTGKIHTSFNQTVTSTGRLSSSNPNLQNIPIRNENGKEIRKAFIADKDCLLLSADYSQIELRIMAHLSQDNNMIEAFNSGHDIHTATAAKIYKVNIKEVTSDMRRKAKTANFGIIYGVSVFGLSQQLYVDRKEAKELIDGYFETYPKVKEYMDKSIERAREKGYAETVLGRKRYLQDINSRNAIVRGYAERNAINAPIQGSAADIIKIAMINIRKRFINEGVKAKMILQVHDELNFSVPTTEREKVEKIVTEEMQNAYKLSVPLKADFGWGQNWLEAH